MIAPNSSFRTALLVTCLLGAVYFCEGLLAQIAPTFMLMSVGGLTFVCLVGVFFVTFILGVIKWRKLSSYWMIPCFICLVGLSAPFVTRPLGEAFNDWQFKSHVADYERVVDEIRSQESPNSAAFAMIDLRKIKTPRNVIEVWAARCADKAVVVHFFVGGAQYQKGYLFKGCDDTALLDSRRPKAKRYKLRFLIGQWYHFSDRL